MIDLKLFRKENNITQLELAEFLGLSRAFIAGVETGKSKLPYQHEQTIRCNDRGWKVTKEMDPSAETSEQKEQTRLLDIIESQQETIRMQADTISQLITEKNRQVSADSVRTVYAHTSK